MSTYYTVTQINEHAYRIHSAENVFCDLLVGGDKALLIDTGYGFDDLQAVVAGITEKPLIIVNTHGHLDHTCGNFRFDAPIYIGTEDMALCREHNTPAMRKKAAQDAQHTMNHDTGVTSNILPDGFDAAAYAAGGYGELLACGDGDTFDLGGLTVHVIETPGHTRGGRSLYCEETQTLYVGDAANFFTWLFTPDSTDRPTYLAGLDRMLEIPFAHAYASHNPNPLSHEELRLFRKVGAEADYAHGFPFSTPLAQPGTSPRVCCTEGMTFEDFGKPGFASVVINEGW